VCLVIQQRFHWPRVPISHNGSVELLALFSKIRTQRRVQFRGREHRDDFAFDVLSWLLRRFGLQIVNKSSEQNGPLFISSAVLFNRCFTEEEI